MLRKLIRELLSPLKGVFSRATALLLVASSAALAGTESWDFTTAPDTTFTIVHNETKTVWWYPTDGNPGGYLSLSDANNSEQLVAVFPDIDGGFPVKAFHLTADVRAGNSSSSDGRPADGFSISYCREGDPVLKNATNGVAGGAAGGDSAAQTTDPAGSGDLENGTKTGVAILFDAWQGNQLPDTGAGGTLGPDVEGISVRVDDKTLKQIDMSASRNGNCTSNECAAAVCADATTEQTGPWLDDGGSFTSLCWAKLDVELNTNKQVTVIWKGKVLLDHFQLESYSPHRGRLVLMGRTGGNNQNVHFDNIQLTTVPATESTFGGWRGGRRLISSKSS